ncbi:branched-chain-amino-acid aminotransferase [Salpingoeca rosetta]|uniref:Branched-chain-amino-acid aminotransferase n=1 Tax=Salpingoeca rosetta (strain ATCC 50818 / BSB-021) TaxID=946362 RepID=F2TWL1_SALR5|nr:branched-chain-amino-acid aminotransferase [Salpingoeca rosetta]EGD72457.1 branched-chain-amino-acid aminotransferase [Salpingoeca rosetta]|eukprot:XP_004999026.1 branched-chain-amino-acid aminotransferase [Salpingoeca rosetta]
MLSALRAAAAVPRTFPATAVAMQARSASSGAQALKYENLVESTTTSPGTLPDPTTLAFGKQFADHMLVCDWSKEEGWAAPVIEPYGDFSLSPSALVLHYGLECFEGMKAFRGVDDRVRLFRPQRNITRLLKSSQRLTLPSFDGDAFLKLLTHLVKKDAAWVPAGRGYSLYIRPTHIATQPILGVGATEQSRLFVINSPVGAYYATGFKPVRLLADPQFVRAWPGGMGDTKCGGNYAPTILPQQHAAERGCQQMLWLFGEDEKVTEVGTMNLFMHWKNDDGVEELITAPLDGTILEGVTRQSIIDLANQWGEFQVSEKYFTMGQLTRALKEGRVYEMFGSGTAATVSPVGEILYREETLSIPLELETSGKLSKRFMDELFAIQFCAWTSDD